MTGVVYIQETSNSEKIQKKEVGAPKKCSQRISIQKQKGDSDIKGGRQALAKLKCLPRPGMKSIKKRKTSAGEARK